MGYILSSPHRVEKILLQFKMKFMILIALVAAVAAAPAELEAKAPIAIVRSASENNDDGSYSFSFETEDGTKVEESGSQKLVGPEPEDIGTVSKGSYSYTGDDNLSLLSTGLPMRTVSKLLVITCPLLPRCPSTSSKCWPI